MAALDNCVHMAFLLPCSCCKLLGCYFGCCCSAAQSKEWFLDAGRTTPNNKKLPNVSSETALNKATPQPPAAAAAAAARSKNSPRIIRLLQLLAAAASGSCLLASESWLLTTGCRCLLTGCWLLAAAGWWLLLPLAAAKTWVPESRTGKHHGSEGRMGQKKMTKNCLTSRLKLL